MRLNPSLNQTKEREQYHRQFREMKECIRLENQHISHNAIVHCAIAGTSNHYSVTERKASCLRGGANGSLPEEAMWESVRGSRSLLQSV